MNPDIFHIGYPRTGTTFLKKSIFKQCKDEIFYTKSKVPQFYKWNPSCKNDLYKNIKKSFLGDKVFLDSEEEFSGDMYEDNYQFPKYIKSINPNAKIILTVRSQFSIIPSIYSLYIKKGGRLSFNQYLKVLITNNKFNYFKLYKSYLDYFPQKQVLLLFFEHLKYERKTYIERILKFINVKKNKLDTQIKAEFKNAKLSDSHIYATYLMNKILKLEVPTRYMLNTDREEALKKLKKRRKYLHVIFYFIKKLNKIRSENKKLFKAEHMKIIKNHYLSDNQKLFNKINKMEYRKYYP